MQMVYKGSVSYRNDNINSWAENYVVLQNGQELFRLENEKQQAIGGAMELQTRYSMRPSLF